MTELLERAIAELKKLPDKQQNEVAMMILKQIQHGQHKLPRFPRQTYPPQNRLSSLWQKVDKLGTDEDEPTMAEITAMVKEVRHSQSQG